MGNKLVFQYFSDKKQSKLRAKIELLPSDPVEPKYDAILKGCPAQSCLGMTGLKDEKEINFYFVPEAGTEFVRKLRTQPVGHKITHIYRKQGSDLQLRRYKSTSITET